MRTRRPCRFQRSEPRLRQPRPIGEDGDVADFGRQVEGSEA